MHLFLRGAKLVVVREDRLQDLFDCCILFVEALVTVTALYAGHIREVFFDIMRIFFRTALDW